MIEAAVPCHKSQAVFRIPEENFLGSFAPQSEPAAADPAAPVPTPPQLTSRQEGETS